jgi:2-haloacid dehalogenase
VAVLASFGEVASPPAACRAQPMNRPIGAVAFDLGGVLIDWDPRHLYRSLFDGDEEAMGRFLAEVCTPEWNARQDAGRSWRDAVDWLVERHPDHRALITAYDERWEEMLGGPIEGTVEIVAGLHRAGTRLAALSNWSAEKFPIARSRYDFLGWFDVIVISGEAGVSKPDPRIYRILLDRLGLPAESVLFIDDVQANIEAAVELGFPAIRYSDPVTLRADLAAMGLVGPST